MAYICIRLELERMDAMTDEFCTSYLEALKQTPAQQQQQQQQNNNNLQQQQQQPHSPSQWSDDEEVSQWI